MQSIGKESTPAFRSLQILTLTEEEQQALAELAASIKGDPYTDFESFYESITPLRENVPERIRGAFVSVRERPRAGALIIRGLPLGDSIPPTPESPFAREPIFNLGTEIYLVILATIAAEPFSFKEWDAGHMVHNKYPIKSHREVQFGSNAVEFLIHTETPFREFSPDYIALLCLRGDPTGVAQTRLCDIGEIIERLPENHRSILEGPFFAFETDNPAVEIEGKSFTLPMPVISTRDKQLVFEYVHDLVAIRADAQAVLDELKAKVVASTINIFLTAGDLILIDNSHMAHGRSAYEPIYNGTDRWLQRLLLTARLFSDRDKSEGRLISDKRLENYTTAYRNVLQSLAPTQG
jgi:L-asparagine oxygenase